MGRLDIRRFYEEFERREIMINPCIKCIKRDRCEGMQQPCKQSKASEAESWLQESGGAYKTGE